MILSIWPPNPVLTLTCNPFWFFSTFSSILPVGPDEKFLSGDILISETGRSCFPSSSGSSGHTATAGSSTSAETCAVATGIRANGDPAITIIALILGPYHELGGPDCVGQPCTTDI